MSDGVSQRSSRRSRAMVGEGTSGHGPLRSDAGAVGQEPLGVSWLASPNAPSSRAHIEAGKPEIKGTALCDGLASFRRREGSAGYQRLLALFDEPTRALFQGEIYPTRWYPLDTFIAFLEATLRATGADEDALIQRSEAVISNQLRGLYRVFVRFASAEFMLRRMAVVHQTYFRGVRISVEFLGRGNASVRYDGLAPRHRLLECVIVGFYRKALLLCGARDVEVQVAMPIEAGESYAEFRLSWH